MKLGIWHKSIQTYEVFENTNVGAKFSTDLDVLAFFQAEVNVFHKMCTYHQNSGKSAIFRAFECHV